MSIPGTHETNDPDAFYVGYLTTPKKHRTAIILTMIVIALWALCMSLMLVLAQRSPGLATWDISNEETWTGFLLEDPYPMLVTEQETLLVVNMGKRDARAALEPFYDSQVTISGYQLIRDGRRIIELSSPDSVRAADLQNTSAFHVPDLEVLDEEPTIHIGEIIDGKCYLGAMKPGDGFAHRSCAILCIKGGLPPMFAFEQRDEGTEIPLILIEDKAHFPEEHYQFVACRVELLARRARFGTLPILLIEPDSIRVLEDLLPHPSTTLFETSGT